MKRIAPVLVALSAMCMLACKGSGDKADQKGGSAGATPSDPAQAEAPKTPASPGGGLIDQPSPSAGAAPAQSPGAAASEPTAATGQPASTGIPECDSYIKRLLSCKDYPQQGKDIVRASVDVWQKDAEAGGDAKEAAADACEKSMQQSDQSLKGIGC